MKIHSRSMVESRRERCSMVGALAGSLTGNSLGNKEGNKRVREMSTSQDLRD